jgi:hypothetical protein
MIAGVVGANDATAGMWRAGGGTFQSSNDGEISSAGGGAGYLSRSSNQGKPLSHRFVGEEAVSALTGLHCKTKLRSTAEADSVPISQCKRDVVSVRALDGTASNSEDAIDNQKGKTGPESR